jgi:SAM-dependent methyltransferase
MMTAGELSELNGAVARGHARYASGAQVAEALEDGLATVDGASFYAVREGVPALLPALRIARRADTEPAAPVSPIVSADERSERVWEALAAQWTQRTPPARPAPADTAVLQRLVGETLEGCPAPRALLLGVTPEIATMRWPSGTRLLAIDASAAMIRKVWPAPKVPDAAVIRGDWAAMPIRDASFDIVVGDASLGIQEYPDAFFAVLQEIRRVLRDGGALATRFYTRPETREPLEAVFADLRAGGIGNLDFFRWRVIAALHGGRAQGTFMEDIWKAWVANVPDPPALAESLGWPPDSVAVMETMRFSRQPMIFPTLGEIRNDLSPEFEETACEFPACEGGDRNPTLVFRAKPRPGGGA